jgi:hypothetical protein
MNIEIAPAGGIVHAKSAVGEPIIARRSHVDSAMFAARLKSCPRKKLDLDFGAS